MPTRRIRTAARRTIVALVLAVTATAVVLPAPHAAANLLPNPGFELSVAEGSILGPSPIHGTLIQPVLPTGWAFEGAAGLFDHADPRADVLGLGGRRPHSGLRFVAISIPASGRRSVCGPEVGCHDNPANIAKDQAIRAASVDPVWRTAAPITVTPGRRYTLSYWTLLDFNTIGTGAFGAVRWLNASAEPLSVSPKIQRLQSETDPVTWQSWQHISGQVTAPAGAAFAVVLLGHTGDVWLGQARFDDIFFG